MISVMKYRIEKLQHFHPSGKGVPNAICYVKGRHSQESEKNRHSFLIPPSLDSLSATIVLPEGIRCPDPSKTATAFSIGQGAFYGSYKIGAYRFDEKSEYMNLWNIGRSQVYKIAGELCCSIEAPLLVRFPKNEELYKVSYMADIDNKLPFMTPKEKKRALGVLSEVEKDIKGIIARLPDDRVFEGLFAAECLLMQETYKRLLDIWPGKTWLRSEEDRLVEEFRSVCPSLRKFDSTCDVADCGISLFNRGWCFLKWENDAKGYPFEIDNMGLGYTDLYEAGWARIDNDHIISPKAVAFIDVMTSYFTNDKRLRKVSALLDQEEKTRERRNRISEILLAAWNNKGMVLQDNRMYVTEMPDCVSGTSFSGPIYFPLGAILESWINCPEFKLPDGRHVIRFASGLSNVSKGEAIKLETGKISEFEAPDASHTRAALVNSSAPYRYKAAQLIKSGILPLTKEELIERISAGDGKRIE